MDFLRRLRFGWVCNVIALLTPVAFSQSPPHFESTALQNGAVQLRVSGSAERHHRIDSSLDLVRWTPVAILSNTNALKSLTRAATNQAEYYRAVEVTSNLEVSGFTPSAAPVGDTVRIEGQFFNTAQPLRNVVRFGSAIANVIEASPVHLTVQVPEGAQSGPIHVAVDGASSESPIAFSLGALLPVRIQPPAGMAQDFVVVNTFGFARTNAAAVELLVRGDLPMINMALDAQTNRVLYAVTDSTSTEALFTMQTTAEALVFMSPSLASLDPLVSTRALELIRTNAEVRTFATHLARTYPLPGDPFEDAALIAAYQSAVRAIATTPALQALARSRFEPKVRALSHPEGDYNVDLEFTSIDTTDDDNNPYGPLTRKIEKGIGPRFPYFNPVDWLYIVQEVDVDRAFPEGRNDFDIVWRKNRPLQNFPLKGDFKAEGNVEPELITERFNPVKFLTGKALDMLKEIIKPPELVRFPDEDALYVVRVIGPSFNPISEADFAREHYGDQRTRVIAANLVAAAMDLIAVMLDGEAFSVAEEKELRFKVALEAYKQVPAVKEAADIPDVAMNLTKFILLELVDGAKEDMVAAIAKERAGYAKGIVGKRAFQLASKQAASKLAGALNLLNAGLKALDVIGSAGQVVQRTMGFSLTTAMETGFVMVGDPFKLSAVAVSPSVASPGQEVEVTITADGLQRLFDPAREGERITLEGFNAAFEADIVSVRGEPNAQIITVRVPARLGGSSDGAYTLFVNTQGRRGSTPFAISSLPVISDVAPAAGFAATANFLDRPFDGSALRVRGAVFTAQSQFYFGEFATVTNRTGSAGNVEIKIPAGARSSRLIVEHRDNLGKTNRADGPVVTVWGAPIIDSVTPASAAIGHAISLQVRDTGVDPDLIRVQFTGADVQSVAVSRRGVITTVVPPGATSGPLSVMTPGGVSSAPFTVTAGGPITNELGGIINVGGASVITLPKALAFALGTDFPNDDPDFSKDEEGRITNLDPPVEEGDFVTDNRDAKGVPRFPIGFNYRDTVRLSGSFADDVDFRGRNDRFENGVLNGKVVVSGDNLTLEFMTFNGEVTISGNSNYFNGTFNGPVRVTGNGNVFRGTVSNTMTIEGERNSIDRVNYRYSPSHGLVLAGDWNKIDGIFDTNSGDGLRLEGGRFNTIEVNRSRGNLGNGVTLTGGAANNTVRFVSGIIASGVVAPDSGNQQHGVALIGDATDNEIRTVDHGSAGNKLDGIYLDGSGVTLNRFESVQSKFNGRNGMTLTNGASNNFIGEARIDGSSTMITLESNRGNGLAIYNAKFTSAAVNAGANAQNGVLISGLNDPPSGTILVVSTGTFVPGNTNAGVRLEKGSTGLRALLNFVERDEVGLELDGAEVQNNVIETRIRRTRGDGIILRGARRNDLRVRVTNGGGTGVNLIGANQNVIAILDCEENQGDGIRLTGSHENKIVTGNSLNFTAMLRNNRNGLVIEQGSRKNEVSNVRAVGSRENGIVLDGAGTGGNILVRTDAQQSGLDGIALRNGASNNSLGQAIDNPFFPARNGSIHDNAGAGIRVTGQGTAHNTIAGYFISPLFRGQPAGIIVENRANHLNLSHVTCARNGDGLIIRESAQQISVIKSIFELSTNNGVWISNSSEISLGAGDPVSGNQVYSNMAGIKITGSAARDCVIQRNFIYGNGDGIFLGERANHIRIIGDNQINNNINGIWAEEALQNIISGNRIYLQMTSAIALHAGSISNLVSDNLITQNSLGIWVNGALSRHNSILNNSITANGAKGIELGDGANNRILPPVFDELQADAILGTSSAPDGSRVQIFQDNADEGATLISVAQVVRGHFRAHFDVDRTKVGILFNLNGTVTDPEGNTSEFSSGFGSDDDGELDKLVWSSIENSNGELYILDRELSGGGPVRLTETAGVSETSPALALACDTIIYTANINQNLDIFSMDATPKAPGRQLTTSPSDDYQPQWLKACEKIVFVSDRDGNPEIYVMNTDGSSQVRLTTNNAIDRSPTASPDGSTIFFESNRSGRFGLWKMNADGSNAQPVLESNSNDMQPAISPDGQWLAFISDRSGKPELHLKAMNGTSVTRLTTVGQIHRTPTWTGDSTSILFAASTANGSEIYVISRAGGAAQPLMFLGQQTASPSVGR